jgi:hypothetical protein
MLEIDLISDGSEYDYDQIVILDRENYQLRMTYNTRREVWVASLYTESGTPLFEGQSVVLQVDLLARCAVLGRPPGALFAETYTQDRTTPGLTDLGPNARCQLFYLPGDEIGS